MSKLTFGFLFIFLVVLTVVECQKWNVNGKTTNGRKASRIGGYYSDETNGGKSAEVNGSPRKSFISQPVKQSSTGGGIGAWGYVSIILFVILSGLGVYYTIIFYPIVCKKQRMYHVMGSTTV